MYKTYKLWFAISGQTCTVLPTTWQPYAMTRTRPFPPPDTRAKISNSPKYTIAYFVKYTASCVWYRSSPIVAPFQIYSDLIIVSFACSPTVELSGQDEDRAWQRCHYRRVWLYSIQNFYGFLGIGARDWSQFGIGAWRNGAEARIGVCHGR